MSKSKSSSSTDQAQTTLSADGVVTGSVINISSKRDATLIQQFPDTVANAFEQLLNFAAGTVEANQGLAQTAVSAAQQASQPDLDLVKKSLGYMPWLVVGLIAIAAVTVWKR
jgi:hypothetical protein